MSFSIKLTRERDGKHSIILDAANPTPDEVDMIIAALEMAKPFLKEKEPKEQPQ